MKNLTIAGGITRDAQLRTTQQGDSVLSFSVGVEERAGGGDKRSLYFDCSLWGKRGAALAQYLTKGSKVTVTGEMSTREHEGKTYLTLKASDVTLQGGGSRDDRPAQREPQGGGRGRSLADDLGEEVPF